MTTTEVKTYDSVEDLFESIKQSQRRDSIDFMNNCSASNIDFELVDEPTLSTNVLVINDMNIRCNIHTNRECLKFLSEKYDENFVSLVQIFTKAGSMILPFTEDQIADAGHDWEGKTVIAEDDILNRTVAALRLYSNSSTIHSLAQHIAYKETTPYPGIDMLKIYRVWD